MFMLITRLHISLSTPTRRTSKLWIVTALEEGRYEATVDETWSIDA